MKLQKFIDRPIFSMVISVVILVAGLIGLYALSVEQYPDIAPPTIRVSTTYSGANAEAVQKSVIVPLEEAINGVENMTYMTSTAVILAVPKSRFTLNKVAIRIWQLSMCKTKYPLQLHCYRQR